MEKAFKKEHLKQRSERGFSDVDAWAFDTYLATVIVNYCRWNREHNAGWPGCFNDEEAWLEVLGKIEKGFLFYTKQYDTMIHTGSEGWDQFEEAKELFLEYFCYFWS